LIRAERFSMTEFIAKHHVKVKFLLVGIWNAIFGYLVFIFFNSFFAAYFPKRYIAYMSALILSNILAIINAYIFHKYVTFKSKIKGAGLLFEFLKFSTTYLVTFCLSLILLPLFVEIMKFTTQIAGALVILCCAVISYLGHSRFSFHYTKLL